MHKGKQMAASRALDFVLDHLSPDTVLGIGTGSTVACFIELLAEYRDRFAGGVATSVETAAHLQQKNIKVFDLNEASIEIYVDGADEADRHLRLIKGGHGALTLEKITASAAKTFICIADSSKFVDSLGATPLPVEVLAQARTFVTQQLRKFGGQPILEKDFLTDHGNQLLRVSGLDFIDPKALESKINDLPGVVCCGIFAHRPADVLYLGYRDRVQEVHPIQGAGQVVLP